jgi:hypothetical protein
MHEMATNLRKVWLGGASSGIAVLFARHVDGWWKLLSWSSWW